MNDQQLDVENEISLLDIYQLIKKNLLVILSFVLIITALSSLYVYQIAKPQYSSKAFFMVQVQSDPMSESYDLHNAQLLLTTAKELVSMPIVLQDVISDLDLDSSYSQLSNNLTVTSSASSYFITVSYMSADPQLSKDITNAVIESAISFADENVPVLTHNLIRTSYADQGIYASPNKLLYIAIGAILGGIMGLGYVFVKEMFNNTFKSKEQLESYLGIHVIGVIPDFAKGKVE